MLTVTVMSTSPETSARLANAVADQYRVQQLDTKLDATRRATEWLGERVSGLRDEVAEKENRVEVYRAQNGLDTAMGTTLAEQHRGRNAQDRLAVGHGRNAPGTKEASCGSHTAHLHDEISNTAHLRAST